MTERLLHADCEDTLCSNVIIYHLLCNDTSDLHESARMQLLMIIDDSTSIWIGDYGISLLLCNVARSSNESRQVCIDTHKK